MGLRTAHAIYKDGALIFADPEMAPEDGAEVVVTFLERFSLELTAETDPIRSLRSRGKGEKLVEKLLESRREDRERDERGRRHLRS
ncbi:MAG: hypothetical protein EHM56_06290 [Chloroflexi bacterium]|nr:MAG: hypothetical protein EHM56_06290 [Chloroflexota bacterium]